MEIGTVAPASADLKSAFRKNPLLWVGFGILMILALLGLFFLGLIGVTGLQNAFVPEEVLETVPEEDIVETPVVNAAYGTVTELNENSLTLSVATDDATITLYFALSSETEYVSFGYANEDDLVGLETPIQKGEIMVGNTVAVYTNEDIGSISSQNAIKVVKVL